jgi:hypothetical protein
MEVVSITPDPVLFLRRAELFRKGGHWNDDDYYVLDCERSVGRASSSKLAGPGFPTHRPQELRPRIDAQRGQSSVPGKVSGMACRERLD